MRLINKVHGSASVRKNETDHRRTQVSFSVSRYFKKGILHRKRCIVLIVGYRITDREFTLLADCRKRRQLIVKTNLFSVVQMLGMAGFPNRESIRRLCRLKYKFTVFCCNHNSCPL